MRCPVDRSLLTEHHHEQLTFAACPVCHGMWFELARGLSSETVEGIRPPYSGRRRGLRISTAARKCVSCQLPLVAEVVDGVEIDRCRQCDAIWLDAGELPAIVAWYRRMPPTQAGGSEVRGPSKRTAGVTDATDIVGDVVTHLVVDGAIEGAVWVAEGVVHFVVACFEGLTDAL